MNIIDSKWMKENECRGREFKNEDNIKKSKEICLSIPDIVEIKNKDIINDFNENGIILEKEYVNGFEVEKLGDSPFTQEIVIPGVVLIHLAIKLLGIKNGDLVFCSSLSFISNCSPVIYEGAEPVFIDSEYKSLNMSPLALEKAFKYYGEKGKMPKAVLVYHYNKEYNIDEVIEICKKYDVPIIEYTDELFNLAYKDMKDVRKNESCALFVYSSGIIKVLGGGILISDDEFIIRKILLWLTKYRCIKDFYHIKEFNRNYEINYTAARMERDKLRTVNERIEKNKNIYEFYQKEFEEIDNIETVNICMDCKSDCFSSIMILKENSFIKASDIILALEDECKESIYIWEPLHLNQVYKKYNFFSHYAYHGISVSESLKDRVVYLPSNIKESDKKIRKIAKVIKNLFI